jgi:chemotaxis protein MotB
MYQNMQKHKELSIVSFLFLISACVPSKKFEELQVKYDLLNADYSELQTLKEYCDNQLALNTAKYNTLESEYEKAEQAYAELKNQYKKSKASYAILDQNYKELVIKNENTNNELAYRLQELDTLKSMLEGQLFANETELLAQDTKAKQLKEKLDLLAADLKEREHRVNELEYRLKMQERAVANLKNKLTESLKGYENSGITVVEKDGKIYVSLDNSLLFESGKIDIDKKGKIALLEVAESLRGLTDFDIMVEGHTDNQAMRSSTIKDNWDLSVLRATSVVRYLTTEGNISPLKIIPSGRSKYLPVNIEETKEAYAQNRRIEIILSPKLEQLMKILR